MKVWHYDPVRIDRNTKLIVMLLSWFHWMQLKNGTLSSDQMNEKIIKKNNNLYTAT